MFKVPERKYADSYRNYKSPTIGVPIVESQSALWRTTYLKSKSPDRVLPIKTTDASCDDSISSKSTGATAVPVSHEHRVISGPHLGKLAFSESMTVHPKDPRKFR